MTTLLAFLFVLGVLVFIHELGHFLLARYNGVKVLTFSLGFGPKILKFQRGDTEYCISIIPLGGYVKMAGENPDDPKTGADDEFMSKSKWQRFQILIAGPAMNLILAVVLLAVVLMQGADVLAYLDRPATVGAVQPGSPAEKAGIRPGDVIVKLGTADIRTWEHLDMAVAARPEREVDVVVMRDGREERLKIRPDLTELRTRGNARFEVGTIGVLPDVHPSVQSLQAGSPSEAAGFKAGDLILAVDGQRMVFRSMVVEAITKKNGRAGRLPGPARRRRSDDQRDAADGGRDAPHRHVHERGDAAVHADADRSDRHELSAQLGDGRPDPGDAARPGHRRGVAEAVDGAGRHRAAVGRVGAGRLDRAARADGRHQPQPRPAQPAADSRFSTAATSSSWASRRSRAATSACR